MVVALFGLASVATAAQAVPATNVATTNAEIQSYGICDSSTGEWVITWKFLNTDTASDATLTNVAPTVATALPNIDNGAVVAKQTTLSGVQRLTAGTNTAGLSVDAAWSSGAATVIGSWNSGAKTCTNNNDCAPLAKGVFTHSFNGPAGSAQVSRSGNQPYPALCAPQRLTLVSYYALSASFVLPQYVFDYTTQDFTPLTYELTFQIALPPCFTQVDFVTGERINPLTNSSGLYGDRKIGSANGTGSYSIGPQGWYNGNGRQPDGRGLHEPSRDRDTAVRWLRQHPPLQRAIGRVRQRHIPGQEERRRHRDPVYGRAEHQHHFHRHRWSVAGRGAEQQRLPGEPPVGVAREWL